MVKILGDIHYSSKEDSEVISYNEFPVLKTEPKSPKTSYVEKISEPGLPPIEEMFTRIGNRYSMRKPVYADTWIIGSTNELEVIEKYETDNASITIGTADDGEIEYNLVPNEYTYHHGLSKIVEETISCIRKEYRKNGSKINRQFINQKSREIITERKDEIFSLISEKCDFEDVIGELTDVVYRYTSGTGIFEVLLDDERLEDIYVDAPSEKNRIYVTLNRVNGCNTHVRCRTNLLATVREVKNLINILMRESGLAYCESNPILETNMHDGAARATVVGYPMSPNGDSIAIRKHSDTPWTLTRLISNGTIDKTTAGLLSFLVDNRSTFLICGSRGAGKSSLLSAMMFEFPISQRILTIEDTLELPGEKMRSMGYKVQSMLIDERIDGTANDRANEALRVSLRLGESAIVLGEVRGEETKTLYESMRTGRAGSSIMGTIHGDSAKTVYDRVVHDLGISPESFMATDYLITMGTFRERGTDKQTRKVSEVTSTSDKPGKFIDITDENGLFSSPAMKRIMKMTSMTKNDVLNEIAIRADMRGFLSELASERSDGYNGPEWIVFANDHLSRCISSGITSADKILESFKSRFGLGKEE